MAARLFDLHGLASAPGLALFAMVPRPEIERQEARLVPDRVFVLQISPQPMMPRQLRIPHRPRSEDFRRFAGLMLVRYKRKSSRSPLCARQIPPLWIILTDPYVRVRQEYT